MASAAPEKRLTRARFLIHIPPVIILSKQEQTLTVGLYRQGMPLEQIAERIGANPHQVRRALHRLINHSWETRHPELAGLSGRAAGVVIRLGLFTKPEVADMIRTGLACRYPHMGAVVLSELCTWCGIKLIEPPKRGSGNYWIEGQMDYDPAVADMDAKIRAAEAHLSVWKLARSALRKRDLRCGPRTDESQ